MAQTVSRVHPSGNHGTGIKVTGTTSGGAVTLYTGVASTTSMDYVELWATLEDTAGQSLILALGGTTDPDNLITCPLAAKAGLQPLGVFPCRNSGTIQAWAGTTANKIVVYIMSVSRVTEVS